MPESPHAKAIGPVEDGAAGVVRALDQAVGVSGTLLMVLGAENEWDWVNERPESERAALLAHTVPFDYRTTPITWPTCPPNVARGGTDA